MSSMSISMSTHGDSRRAYAYQPTPDPSRDHDGDGGRFPPFLSDQDGDEGQGFSTLPSYRGATTGKRPRSPFVVALAMVALVLALGGTYYAGETFAEPRVVEVKVEVPYPVDRVIEMEKIVEVPVEKIVYQHERVFCGLCETSPDMCDVYGRENLELGRAYTGTGRRLRKLMRKAMRGEKIKTSVIGGSVSEGVDVEENMRWHEIASGWFKNAFPDIEVEHVVGAVPGRGSDYFNACHAEHIDTDVDLIIIELGINDWQRADMYFHDMEALLRAVLSYPNQPAVMLAESFTIALPSLSTGTDSHLGLANYYDVPALSLRNWLLPAVMDNPSLKDTYFFGDRDGTGKHNDYLHISRGVHKALGDHFATYFNQQLCIIKNGLDDPEGVRQPAYPWPQNHDLKEIPIPRLRLTDAWDDSTIVPAPNSNCLSLNSPHESSTLTIGPESWGWNPWEDDIPWRHVKKYMRADEVGSRINWEVELVEGSWTLYYLRSPKKGLGNLWCFSDDNREEGVMVEGYWTRKMDVGEVLPIQKGLEPGFHTLSCEVDESTSDPDGGHTFLIVALIASPALHNTIFESLGIPHRYSLHDTKTIDDPSSSMLQHFRSPTFGGASVTMPLKVAVIPLLDRLEKEAEAIGSINTIVVKRKSEGGVELVGQNFDWIGIRNAVTNALPPHISSLAHPFGEEKSGFIIGGGGTTRAAVYALTNLGLSPIFILNRDPLETAEIIKQYPKEKGYDLRALKGVEEWGEEEMEKVVVGVGAIPSAEPKTEGEKMVYEVAEKIFGGGKGRERWFLEMCYKPRHTLLMSIAETHGVEAMIEQALAQQRAWLFESEASPYTEEEKKKGLDVKAVEKAKKLVREMDDIKPKM
ncbi:hypothetical protein MNV49_002553 [Pseudohyphozyma bogoriensis]|nr:hypothetical protein MNV49_002553 [Pseudohyphozyma bogoriensis]